MGSIGPYSEFYDGRVSVMPVIFGDGCLWAASMTFFFPTFVEIICVRG